MQGQRGGRRVRVTVIDGAGSRNHEDVVAVEEPLELRLQTPSGRFPLAVTMRTPGHDFELAAGFLHGEGVVRSADDVRTLSYCTETGEEQRFGSVLLRLAEEPTVAAAALARRFTVSSACGVCGIDSLDALDARGQGTVQPLVVRREVLVALPDRLREAQRVFDSTGGLHAAGLFTADGEPLVVREDVGRHNAMDKVVGWALMAGRLPLQGQVLVVSGRTSFELVQKAVAAGAGCLAGVSAPSSLAVELARRSGLALVGFLRGERFVVYAGEVA